LGRNRRDWVLVVSSVIIGILLPIIIERWPWPKNKPNNDAMTPPTCGWH
jgi:hypothetical protein